MVCVFTNSNWIKYGKHQKDCQFKKQTRSVRLSFYSINDGITVKHVCHAYEEMTLITIKALVNFLFLFLIDCLRFYAVSAIQLRIGNISAIFEF